MVSLIISVCNLIVRKESSDNPSEVQRSPIETNQRHVTLCGKAKFNSFIANANRIASPINEHFGITDEVIAEQAPIVI